MPTLPFIRSDVRDLAGYTPGEQPRDGQYVKLNTNENPYPPSPGALDAIRGATTGDVRLYPDPAASELRAKASATYGLPPEGILAGNGSDELLALVMRACVAQNDGVAYPVPTYSLYETLVAVQGGRSIQVPFPDDYRLPVEHLTERGQRVTIVCNPNAPSGTVAPVALIERLAQKLRGLLVVDEAYMDFAAETALPLVCQYSNVLVLRTFSKSFSLCGLRVGLAFGHPDVVAQLAKVKDSYSVNRFGLVAAAAALDDLAWMEANVRRIRAARGSLVAGLRHRGFDVFPSDTNFVLARVSGGDMRPVQQRLKARGVLVRFFEVPRLRDSLRITVGTPEQIDSLFEALDAT